MISWIAGMILFSGVEIDQERREIRRDGKAVSVQPQVFDLLIFIIDNRDRVVTRDDLIEHIWAGRIVSESTLATRINAARKALGDDGSQQRLIRTIHGRGIRFVGNLTSPENEHAASATPNLGNEFVELFLPKSIGTEPDTLLATMSLELSEQLIAAFSGQVFLSLKLEDPPTDSTNSGYCVSSSIRQIDDQVRLSIKLSRVDTTSLLWASNFDFSIEGWLDGLSLASDKIVNQVFSNISNDRTRQAGAQNIEATSAIELFYQARHLWQSKIPEENFAAEKLLNRSIELQPELFSGYIGLASTYLLRASSVWSEDVVGDLEKGRSATSVAANTNPRSFAPPHILAYFAAYKRQFDAAFEYVELAGNLDPTSGPTINLRGVILSYMGQTEEALEQMELGEKIFADQERSYLNIGRTHFIGGNYDLAIPKLEMFVGLKPAADLAQLFLGNCYDATGQPDKARACVDKQMSLCPFTSLERISHVTPYPAKMLKTFRAFLRRYDVPEN